MDRAHRIGQRRMVNVYRLVTADSIEERIMSLQAFKTHLARTLVSQPANRSLGDMQTGSLLDNLSGDRQGRQEMMVGEGDGAGGGGEEHWGDLEAAQYAEEYGAAFYR